MSKSIVKIYETSNHTLQGQVMRIKMKFALHAKEYAHKHGCEFKKRKDAKMKMMSCSKK